MRPVLVFPCPESNWEWTQSRSQKIWKDKLEPKRYLRSLSDAALLIVSVSSSSSLLLCLSFWQLILLPSMFNHVPGFMSTNQLGYTHCTCWSQGWNVWISIFIIWKNVLEHTSVYALRYPHQEASWKQACRADPPHSPSLHFLELLAAYWASGARFSPVASDLQTFAS